MLCYGCTLSNWNFNQIVFYSEFSNCSSLQSWSSYRLYSVRFHLELTQPYFITLGSHRFLSLCFFTPGSPNLSSPISSPPLSLNSVHPNLAWLWAGRILRNSNVMCWNFYMSVKSNTLQPRKLIMFYWFAWY